MKVLRLVGAGVRWALLLEWRMYVGVWRLVTRRHDIPAGAAAFSYVGAVSVLLWAFTVVSTIELVVLHVIIPWENVRLAADILGIWGVVWMLGMTGCHYVYPHLVTEATLRVRSAGQRDQVTIPWELVASVAVQERSVEKAQRLLLEDGGRRVLHVEVASRTNVDVRLTRPLVVHVRRATHEVTEVRLFADDPGRLRTAIRAQAGRGATHRA